MRVLQRTNKAIFLDQVNNHVPLPTITNWGFHQSLDEPAIQRLIKRIDDF